MASAMPYKSFFSLSSLGGFGPRGICSCVFFSQLPGPFLGNSSGGHPLNWLHDARTASPPQRLLVTLVSLPYGFCVTPTLRCPIPETGVFRLRVELAATEAVVFDGDHGSTGSRSPAS